MAVFAVVLLLGWFCYRPAFQADFELDDVANLGDLAYIDSRQAIADFVLAGEAGPMGRPLALLSFALQADEWEDGAGPFLRVNVLIHLLNAVLLAWCLYALARLRSIDATRATYVATAAAGLWLLLPILASSTLLVVQRMTTLSALFLLLGLGIYLLARRYLPRSPGMAWAGMTAGLVLGTLLSALAKESGLLLPLYVLVIELTLLRRPESVRAGFWRTWQAVFLYLPAFAILAYLATQTSYSEALVLRRDFDAWQRLLTESRVLWQYIFKAAVGLPGSVGIYQGSPPVARSLADPLTLFACLSWPVLIAAAIARRRRNALFAFAVLWFVAGHLIESTVIPLELYFEHRNYLPLIGPVFSICCFAITWSVRSARVAAVALPCYMLLNAVLLHSFASIWGQPAFSAHYWAERYPDSVRAATRLATYQLAGAGPDRTIRTLADFAESHPGSAYLRIQQLNLGCLTGNTADNQRLKRVILNALPHVDFTYTAGTMLSDLFSTTRRIDCPDVNTTTVIEFANALRSNPRYNADARYNQLHFELLAAIAHSRGDAQAAIEHLETAISYSPSSELNSRMVMVLAGQGRLETARRFIDNAAGNPPRNLVKAIAWQRDLDRMREFVDALAMESPAPTSDPEAPGD